MRLNTLVLCAVLYAAPGCGLFEAQVVELTSAQVELLEAQLGTLTKNNQAAWMHAVEEQLGLMRGAVTAIEGANITLTAPISEAGQAAGSTLVDAVASSPTTSGLVAGVPLALFALLGVLARRRKLRPTGAT